MSRIGVVGGGGKLGSALAASWARAGLDVSIGSRDPARAAEAAAAIEGAAGRPVGHGGNVEVAAAADIVVVTVPWASQADVLHDVRDVVQGKIVVDTTVPLMPPRVMRVQLPAVGSAALSAQAVLGDGVRVVSAFHNVAAAKLARGDATGCDVLVFGDDREARVEVVALARAAGLLGWEGGALANSAAAEALTSVLIFMNKRYGADGAGIAIVGAHHDG